MGIGWEIGSAVAGVAAGAYDLYSRYEDRQYQRSINQRDFDYQRALQQQIFEREDNAVQRRRADLEAAGLNPNLAAGSAAGAGSVVGRSSTPSLPSAGNPVGTALDMAQNVAQLKAQKKQNIILDNQERTSRANAEMAEQENNMSKIEYYNMLGLDPYLFLGKNGRIDVDYDYDGGQIFKPGSGYFVISELGKNGRNGIGKSLNDGNSRIMNYLNWQYQNNQNSAAMLQKDFQYYDADKIANYLGIGASIFSGAGSGFLNFRKGYFTNRR